MHSSSIPSMTGTPVLYSGGLEGLGESPSGVAILEESTSSFDMSSLLYSLQQDEADESLEEFLVEDAYKAVIPLFRERSWKSINKDIEVCEAIKYLSPEQKTKVIETSRKLHHIVLKNSEVSKTLYSIIAGIDNLLRKSSTTYIQKNKEEAIALCDAMPHKGIKGALLDSHIEKLTRCLAALSGIKEVRLYADCVLQDRLRDLLFYERVDGPIAAKVKSFLDNAEKVQSLILTLSPVWKRLIEEKACLEDIRSKSLLKSDIEVPSLEYPGALIAFALPVLRAAESVFRNLFARKIRLITDRKQVKQPFTELFRRVYSTVRENNRDMPKWKMVPKMKLHEVSGLIKEKALLNELWSGYFKEEYFKYVDIEWAAQYLLQGRHLKETIDKLNEWKKKINPSAPSSENASYEGEIYTEIVLLFDNILREEKMHTLDDFKARMQACIQKSISSSTS